MSEHFGDVRVALAKGRIMEQVASRWEASPFPWRLRPDSRRLWFEGDDEGPGAFIVRGPDIPVLVERGVADLGIVGMDLLAERGESDLLVVSRLKLAQCRVVLAGKDRTPPDGPFLVASKYRRLTSAYLARKHWQADIVPLSGSLELAPWIGLAPYIVDIVETGETLREHDLVEIETVFTSSAVLIANPAHWRTKPEVVAVRDRLTAWLGASDPPDAGEPGAIPAGAT